MIKAFLSHSSKDKESYVRPLAKKLGRGNIIFDEMTFEEGEKAFDEILKGLSQTELFVLLLSDSALASEWVQKEITEAKNLLDEGEIKKVFPIIIDEKITYQDSRIPEWLRQNYNLRLVKRTDVAARRILSKLNELSWVRHPRLEKIHRLFVGRNDKLEEFEERIDDFSRSKPNVVFATGLQHVGRRTFLHKALTKTNIFDSSYQPPRIYLDRNSSIEDFLLKLNDLGLIDLGEKILSLADKSISVKQELVREIMVEAHKSKDVIFIIDNGCLVNFEREISEWFSEIINTFEEFDYPVFCCASIYKVPFRNRPKNDKYFFVELSELNPKERKRLLNQLLQIHEVSLTEENFNTVAELLSGLPEQVMYTARLIKEDSSVKLIDKLQYIQEYNTEKAAVLLQKYEDDPAVLDFIRLLAQFEIITLEFVFSVVDEQTYSEILSLLISENICELIGVEGEIVRLNDVIRDYIKRNMLHVNTEHARRINSLVTTTITEEELFQRDSSEYIFTVKEALVNGYDVDERLLIPSHYLRCMKDLYYNKANLDRVVELADFILAKEHNMEPRVVQDIRYTLCLALAKKKDSRLLEEVQQIHGYEHHFLLGFYYRRCRQWSKAHDKFIDLVDKPYVGARSKRELVQVYIQLEEYDKALAFAQRNYEENKGNQFHTQAYFNCLINSENIEDKKETLKGLISNLRLIDSEQSNEMADIADALYVAKIEANQKKAFEVIDAAVARYPRNHYPLLTKCDIALKYRNIEVLEQGVDSLRRLRKNDYEFSLYTLQKYRAFLEALKGNEFNALNIIRDQISKFPPATKEKIVAQIKEYAKSV